MGNNACADGAVPLSLLRVQVFIPWVQVFIPWVQVFNPWVQVFNLHLPSTR